MVMREWMRGKVKGWKIVEILGIGVQELSRGQNL
jgi:hypothetical protein